MSVVNACCRTAIAGNGDTGLSDELGDTDVRELLQAAHAHGVLPLVFPQLQDAEDEVLSGPVEAEFTEASQQIAQRNLVAVRELLAVLERYRAHEIDVLAYKGPTLATRAYGNISRRRFTDIDLIVSPAQLDTAQTQLESLGYRERERLAGLREIVMENTAGVQIDLHATPVPRYFPGDVQFEALWRHRTTIELSGTTVPVPSAEDLLTILCIHGTKHCWYRLSWLCDIAALVQSAEIDWDRVGTLTEELRSQRMLSLGLALTESVLGVDVPTPAQDRSTPAAVEPLIRQSQSRLGEPNPSPPSWRTRIPYQLRAFDQRIDSLRFLRSLAFEPTPADKNVISLPEFLTPVYGVIRPVRIIGLHGLERLRNDDS